MKVRFGSVDEFVDELKRDVLGVANMRVRLTTAETQTSVPVRCMWVIAGAKVLSGVPGHDDFDLVELRRHVGDLWGLPEKDAEIADRANEIVAELRERLEEIGFIVAAGMYQEVG